MAAIYRKILTGSLIAGAALAVEVNRMTRNTARPDYHQAWRVHERMRAALLREAYGPLWGDADYGQRV